jgi:hypothetical protein
LLVGNLWIFLQFYFIERVHPIKNGTGKNIQQHERLAPIYNRLEKLERAFKKLLFAKSMAWNLAVVATK